MVIAEQQQAANSLIKRSKTVTVVLLKEIPATLPRGPIREQLRRFGRIKNISVNQTMTESEVKNLIMTTYLDIAIHQFEYLGVTKSHSLTVASNQCLDGRGLINLAGNGCV